MFIALVLSVVRLISTRMAVMYLGSIVETGLADLVVVDRRHPYAVAPRSAVAIRDLDRPGARLRIVLRGDLPSPLNPPACHHPPGRASDLIPLQRPPLR